MKILVVISRLSNKQTGNLHLKDWEAGQSYDSGIDNL